MEESTRRRRERQSSVNGTETPRDRRERDSVLLLFFQLDSFNEADKSIRQR
jgi:hypothetical protein